MRHHTLERGYTVGNFTELAEFLDSYGNSSLDISTDWVSPDSRQDVAAFNREIARFPRLSQTAEIQFLTTVEAPFNNEFPGSSAPWFPCLNSTCEGLIRYRQTTTASRFLSASQRFRNLLPSVA